MKMLELIGKQTSNAVAFTFERMEVAEQEIAAAKRRAPSAKQRVQVQNSFKMLFPREMFKNLSVAVYRHHARELLDRVIRDQPLEPGTDAECLCVMMEQTLKAPPNENLRAAIEILFRNVMGEEVYKQLGEPPSKERWHGAARDLIEGLRRKLSTNRDVHEHLETPKAKRVAEAVKADGRELITIAGLDDD